MANVQFFAEVDGGIRRPADEFTLARFFDCLKANTVVQALFQNGPPITRLQVGSLGPDGFVPDEDCVSFLLAGNPFSLNVNQFSILPIQPGGAPSPPSGAPANAASATAAGEIDGFSIASPNGAGALVAGVTVSGLAPVAAAAFLSILTDSTGFAERFESLFDGADRFTGAALDDSFSVGAGNDTVLGFGGDDIVFKSRPGDLRFEGGAGSDTLAFRAATGDVFPTPFLGGAVVDLAAGTGTSPYGGALTLISVENVIGTSLADTIRGDDGPNVFGDGQFDGGADLIDGRGGNDVVKLSPSSSGVRANGGAGFDTLFFQFDRFVNRLDLVDQSRNSGVFGGGTFTSFERFERGTDFAPFDSVFEFRGDAGAQHVVVTSGDTMIDLGGGNDVLELRRTSGSLVAEGGPGTDELRIVLSVLSNPSTVLDLLNPAAGTGAAAGATLSGFERFIGVEGPNFLTPFLFKGDGAAQFVQGARGADVLEGRAGADTLMGLGGADTLIGGAGRDRLEPGRGADVMTGGVGPDVFVVGAGDGTNRILDFEQGRDRIEIRSGADGFADLSIEQTGADVTIRFANVRVIAADQRVEDFTGADFLF